MKFNYYADTDSLYIDLAERQSMTSKEIAPGVVVDFDDRGRIVGIDIDHASQVVNLSRIEAESLPVANLSVELAPPFRRGVD
jgi:uncharacterized protein YuzE